MANIKFKWGGNDHLEMLKTAKAFEEGTFYIDKDRETMHLATSNDTMIDMTGASVVNSVYDLPNVSAMNAGKMYYVRNTGDLVISNGKEMVSINPEIDTGATSVEVVGSGNAVTSASYDAGMRKLTLTMGETFAKNADLTALSDKVGTVEEGKTVAQMVADANAAATQALTDAKAYVDAEDKFEIDMLTVNAHGGVAANEDLNGLTTHEILKKILYPYVQPTVGNATATPNGGTYEKGVTKTITSVSISVTKKSEAITSVALYNGSTLIEEKTGDTVKNGGTITFSGLSVVVPTDGNQLTVKVTDAKGTVQEKKTSAMTFVYPYYMGTCAAGTAVDETLVESLTKKIESKGNKSNSFTVSDGHMVFAYPKAHGVLKSILDPNNFETIGNYTRSEVSVTGLDGTAQTYYVYVSGATTVSGFVVNFKY